ncbi:DEAD/DEAH box helicase [Paenibacillus sp. 1011MAR3C5]|uniref:DEAD/DEAH box helicase n=1 Tax=Paenibacillus sp. 1011MAR3C5 TaxID=1675787 RepID=UPI000E6C314A|nr:DEAD/DEAH box helicase [Paenibacillus sp. 1011MAR3C5]RJE85132.1 DEAD/DEAH box helicase [Paenibacillus sp. 1011MAR3C5]
MNFQELNLIQPILQALSKENYTEPTPIQERSIPSVLAGRDLLGCAQTGTGKTAAFSLPMIQLLSGSMERAKKNRPIRGLILSPTRELALQISDNIQAYSQFTQVSCLAIVGGVSQSGQERALAQGTDILIATPGRLMDLLNQKVISLQAVEMLVLDEADRMLDMGFINDVKKIIAKLPAKRQTLFFSATMPPEIAHLADSLLTDPVKVEVTPVSSTVERIHQSLYLVDKENKQSLLNELLADQSIVSALVFTRTKHGADRVARGLNKQRITAQAIHGDKSQNARQNALSNFKSGATRVLVATDIAARGIDVEELSHVINFNLPNIPETYVHRIGRTGRAGHDGTAISFCEKDELPYLKDIEKLIKKKIPVVQDHPYPMKGAAPAAAEQGSSKPAAAAESKSDQGGAGGSSKSRRRKNKPQAAEAGSEASAAGQSKPQNKPQSGEVRQLENKPSRSNGPKPQEKKEQARPQGQAPAKPSQPRGDRPREGQNQRQAGKSARMQQQSKKPTSADRYAKPQLRQEVHQESGAVISILPSPWSSFSSKSKK